jgi:hypothetical protein
VEVTSFLEKAVEPFGHGAAQALEEVNVNPVPIARLETAKEHHVPDECRRRQPAARQADSGAGASQWQSHTLSKMRRFSQIQNCRALFTNEARS